MPAFVRVASLCVSCLLVVIFGYQIRQVDDVDQLLRLPATAAGAQAKDQKPPGSVISNALMDRLAVDVLESLPDNTSRTLEHVGYLFFDGTDGEYKASEPQQVKAISRRKHSYTRIRIPAGKEVVGVYNDHFQDTLPGPGHADSHPVLKGMVSYVRDVRGSIYKIEYSISWKTPANNDNGWRLTTLKGRDLVGQEQWRPGVIFTRYVKADISRVSR